MIREVSVKKTKKKQRNDGWGVRRRGCSAATLSAFSDNRGSPVRAEPYLSSGGAGGAVRKGRGGAPAAQIGGGCEC